jgi:Leucine-rich repeat (LRR) protein
LNLRGESLNGILDLSDFVNLTELDISNSNLEKLILTNCSNLKILDCSDSNLGSLDVSKNPKLTNLNCSSIDVTELNLTNCSNLIKFDCSDSDLEKLDITACKQLRVLNCNNSNLEEIIYPSGHSALTELDIGNTNLPSQDLSFLSHLISLEILNVNDVPFCGSLEPLKNLTKLKQLDISNTDLNSGVEFLSTSLETIKYGSTGKVREMKK